MPGLGKSWGKNHVVPPSSLDEALASYSVSGEAPRSILKFKMIIGVCVLLNLPDSLRLHGLQPTRLLRLWDFPVKDTGVCCHFLLQRLFLTQGSNQVSCIGRRILYHRFCHIALSTQINPGVMWERTAQGCEHQGSELIRALLKLVFHQMDQTPTS